MFDVRPNDLDAVAANGRAPDGVPARFGQTPASTNAYLSAKYGRSISLPSDHDILPYQIVQLGTNRAFFYLKASYTFGR